MLAKNEFDALKEIFEANHIETGNRFTLHSFLADVWSYAALYPTNKESASEMITTGEQSMHFKSIPNNFLLSNWWAFIVLNQYDIYKCCYCGLN